MSNQGDRNDRSTRNVLRAIGVLLGIMFVLQIAVAINTERNSGNIDGLQAQNDRVEAAIEDVREVTELARENVVEGSTPEARERQTQIFQAIFDTLSLLCEQFPDSQVCQGG